MLNKFFDKFKSKKDDEETKNTEEDLQQEELEVSQSNENIEISEEVNDAEKVVEEKNEKSETDNEKYQEQSEEIIEDKEKNKEGFFEKLKNSLLKTRDNISNKIDQVLANYRTVDEELFEEIEETLISADIGVETTLKIVAQLRDKVKLNNIQDPSEIKNVLADILKENIINDKIDNNLNVDDKTIILVVGVNGVGKTTTIGKLAMKFKKDGKKVLMVAADTFRAAAIEQLTEWANRAKVDIISHKEGSDPASVVFDGVSAMKSRDADILICDTAGRLHNKKNLMNELNKIKRVIEKEYPEAKKEILLIVDGTTGQNAIIQAKEFMNATDLTGAIITKLDGTAKGGMIFPLEMELGIPVKFIGIGEQVNDLVKFEPEKFIEAIIN
ncbi:MAG: signal recognition particle-docking protein FtsY [Finegoldia magna]|jgi:signal recognition particle-docking protein ftsY|uniref:Signal recognition particle receptor FtsY n=1 Tax=Finegoldia magna TaxID=1260 RepID=A0A233V5H0_FINMA|nr:signal recognition particle-docking protein FtsY [Finegoldia magna]MDU2638929.1 signal recognition particle-docking protein FtsY [Finegoldia magna]MDU5214243.1 signal recognition particle-docking protein FtsY [Finegoldia magna]MDU5224448.1 signal recognition particle-docking protein FtsY [Finegoldia magna]MDU5236128.1 signal recognition particle-docking protein FtsY [Finegoldia magna]OXZ27638.1 signal recognition particle-docking protein FtsY [Finegoldia magna]